MRLEINEKIKLLLKDNSIRLDDGITYLLSIYYGLSPTYIPDTIRAKVNSLNIFTIDYVGNFVTWKEPLFDNIENNFEWVGDYMDLFKVINPDRRGVKKIVIKKFKEFLRDNPFTSVDEIFEATKLYISTVTKPEYIMMSQYFINKDGGSMLEEYLHKIRENKDLTSFIDDEVL